jgi:uncharacterized protein (UPF0335 family)
MEREHTISVNGGPEVPLSTVRKALDMVKAGVSVGRAARAGEGAEAAAARARQEADAAPEAVSSERLRSLVERIERLNEERKALGSDIKDIYAEAKSAGFDVKALRQVIRMRTWKPAELEEHETLVDVYCRALGM